MAYLENTVGMNGGVQYGIYLASPNAEWGDKMVSGKRDGTASHDMIQHRTGLVDGTDWK
jgi:hypothetical protein